MDKGAPPPEMLCGSAPPDLERIVAKGAAALREDYGQSACREAFERVLLMLALDNAHGFQIWLHVGWRLAVAEGKLGGAPIPNKATLDIDRVHVTGLAIDRPTTQRPSVSVLMLAACLGACSTMRNDPPPDGATALCRDSTISYAPRSAAVCADHDGVARWLEPRHRRGEDEQLSPPPR